MKKLLDEILKGDRKLYDENNTINFKCQACGNCCLGSSVPINSFDIWMMLRAPMIKKFGAVTTNDLIKYGLIELHWGSYSGLPVATVGKLPKINGCVFLAPVMDEQDQFIKNPDGSMKLLCALEENKPHVCRLFPLGRIKSIEGNKITGAIKEVKWKYFIMNENCPGMKNPAGETKIGDWVKKSKVSVTSDKADWFNDNIVSYLHDCKYEDIPFNDVRKAMVISAIYDFDSIPVEDFGLGIPSTWEWEMLKNFIELMLLTIIEKGGKNGKIPDLPEVIRGSISPSRQ